MAFDPYLMFPGTCREAMTYYQSVLGGELQIVTFADVPGGGGEPPADPDSVMHAALVLADGMLLASDDPGDPGAMSGIHVNFTAPTAADAERIFAALSDGGTVTLPIEETFWSPRFGMCVDRFGTPWMVNAQPAAG